MSRHRCLGWMLALAIWVAAIPAAEATDFGRYHNYAELSAALKTLVAAHPTLARMTSIGRTGEGRDIWVVEIASQKGRPLADRPALLVAASLEGDHLVGSELALFLVDHLLRGYAADPVVRQRLDEHVVYVVPRVNPDGAEAGLADGRWRR
ncbi:MAG TPA: M14 family zinc carboxypeptidase, partial [Vicinamibacterales bacterium]|nr:M14 family zinc carboxypeptidase [Vicinamibacterales bacterium]